MEGGQTKADPSGWSVDTLHTHIQSMLNERDRLWLGILEERDKRYTQRFEAQQDALTKVDAATREAKAAANEWRGAMSDREAKFTTKAEFDLFVRENADWRTRTMAIRERIGERVTIIETRLVTWIAALGVFFLLFQFAINWAARK